MDYMTPIHINAEWSEIRQQMITSLEAEGNKHVEAFSKTEWAEFIKNLDSKPLRIGGLQLEITESTEEERESFLNAIKIYLRKVDEAFKATGNTDFLKGQ